jgi:hypothetical protein
MDPCHKAGELSDISATSPSDMWAVGWSASYGGGKQADEALILLHWGDPPWIQVAA